jgi:hypothetical protein
MVKRTCKSGTDVLEEDRERSKQRKRVSGVQIRPSPPSSPAVAAISGEQREMAALVARFERPTEPERDKYRRHSTLCECFYPRGHRLVRFRNRFG